MIAPYSNGTFGIVTTDGCTAQCAHCMMNCKPGKKKKLSFEQIQKALDQALKKYKIHLVIFTGGEPTLLGDDLIRAIRYCTLKFLRTRVVTNAHWATSPERAKRYVQAFRDVGLSELDFSIDDYHEPFVPLQNIKNAWGACKNAGFDAVVLANSHGPSDKIVPDYIKKYLGEDIPLTPDDDYTKAPKAKDGTIYLIHEATLQKSGRAISEISEKSYNEVGSRQNLSCNCPWAVNDPVLSPSGHIWACCGLHCENNPFLDLGDTAKESVSAIFKRASDNIILNAIHYLGPLKLVKIVEEHSKIRFDKKYYNVCEICNDITSHKKAIDVIRKNYAELVPQILRIKSSETQEK